ncbi:hypothetical protein ACH4PW_31680 [Streptomyces sp. NPDC017082]|uniref:hypothetical protein n=1 Tax=Streptomyces sp. NPDC017082 TaxID=3364974 RepID=UPI00379F14F4
MANSSLHVKKAISEAAQASAAWNSAGATVRFILSNPGVDIILDPQGRETDAEPTHVMNISWPDLKDIAEGRRSFLRSLTTQRFTARGPVLQTIAFGQALATFELDH